jgi:nucleoside-diphosphate-sugar epimerase
MARALIGHTGFVGGNLLRQGRYTELYNSTNIDTIAGRSFELVVSAGCRAAKWIANKEPAADHASVARLMDALDRVRAERFVLISTIDVYSQPIEVDEAFAPAMADVEPYGKHRLELEQFVRARFPKALIVRLPGLFGVGLRKNAIYDLLHGNRLDLVHQDGRFQFYDLERIGADVERGLDVGLEVVNLATEPVAIREVARAGFGHEFDNALPPPAPRYDVRTRHARVWGRNGHYLASAAEVLDGIRRFVERERAGRP